MPARTRAGHWSRKVHSGGAVGRGDTPSAARIEGGPVERISLKSEIGQSFYLMGLMATMLAGYVGLGLLAVRVLG